MRPGLRYVLSGSLCAVLGFSAGAVVAPDHDHMEVDRLVDDPVSELRSRARGLSLINPLLDCDDFRPSSLATHELMRDEMERYIADATEEGVADHISLYFRSLNSGTWIGIEEDRPYAPASLLKVPILMAALKMAESDSALLLKEFVYPGRLVDRSTQRIGGGTELVAGTRYPVAALLSKMIQKSDNEATEMLRPIVGPARVLEVLHDLAVVPDTGAMQGDFITPREYGAVFRTLFNATYLTEEMSQFALELLSRAEFGDGIPSLLPPGTLVAHKFGERGSGTESRQLHDCGIVYVRHAPYLICIMTEGKDYEDLARTIAALSRIAYNHVTTDEPR